MKIMNQLFWSERKRSYLMMYVYSHAPKYSPEVKFWSENCVVTFDTFMYLRKHMYVYYTYVCSQRHLTDFHYVVLICRSRESFVILYTTNSCGIELIIAFNLVNNGTLFLKRFFVHSVMQISFLQEVELWVE